MIHPVNDSDRLTFMQSLEDPAYGVMQEFADILNTLNPEHKSYCLSEQL